MRFSSNVSEIAVTENGERTVCCRDDESNNTLFNSYESHGSSYNFDTILDYNISFTYFSVWFGSGLGVGNTNFQTKFSNYEYHVKHSSLNFILHSGFDFLFESGFGLSMNGGFTYPVIQNFEYEVNNVKYDGLLRYNTNLNFELEFVYEKYF